METVSREDGGFTIDVVQRYLDPGKDSDAGQLPASRENECEVQRRAVVRFVDLRVDLEVGPMAGRCCLQLACGHEDNYRCVGY